MGSTVRPRRRGFEPLGGGPLGSAVLAFRAPRAEDDAVAATDEGDGVGPVKLERRWLDAPGLVAHLRELAASAEGLEVRVKDAELGYSSAADTSLEEHAERLVRGELVALQARFRLDDSWWSDTVMRVRDRFHSIRMREEEPPDRS